MSTIDQVEANRRNGALSKGHKTPQGKTASAKNALKHGLLSEDTLLPDEDPQTFDELAEGLRAALAPEGTLETELAERIVVLTWRLRRIGKAEHAILAWHHFGILGMDEVCEKEDAIEARMDDLESHEIEDFDLPGPFPRNPYEQADYNARRIAKEAGLCATVSSGKAFSESERSLEKLSRYETSIERSFYKALHELQRLQAARKGEAVPLSVAVDIDVTGLPEPTRAPDQLRSRE
jgi:hypothetical protein